MTIEEVIKYWEGLRKTFSCQLEKEENHFGRMHLQTTIDVLDTTLSVLREKQESICAKQKDICGCTNLPCAHCNPGPCGNRKEAE